MKEKVIITHVDTYLDNGHEKFFRKNKPSLNEKIRKMCEMILSIIRQSPKDKVQKINEYTQNISEKASVYIIENGTSATSAAKDIIKEGDSVTVLGIYKDACVANVAKVAEKKGATTNIPEDGSIDLSEFI